MASFYPVSRSSEGLILFARLWGTVQKTIFAPIISNSFFFFVTWLEVLHVTQMGFPGYEII